jgi:light-harvesting protein B-800-850 alpha chain
MNNAKLWLVVSPNVGIPLFLTAVAVSSFAVHVGIIANTTWIEDYHSGKSIMGASAALTTEEAPVAKAAWVPEGSQEVIVTMPDGTQARAILQMPATMAALK